MIRVMAVTKKKEIVQNITLEETKNERVEWYWVDISEPNAEEAASLKDYFQFHPLAIEDCLEHEQRPKIDVYDNYWFLILNKWNKKSYKPEELNIFIGDKFLVSFHQKKIDEVERIWEDFPRYRQNDHPMNLLHHMIDALVDQFFPPLYEIEDRLPELDGEMTYRSLKVTMNEVYKIRGDLAKLRKAILPMRDLVYKLLYMETYGMGNDTKYYFKDIHDHLVQLAYMIDENYEFTADIRDNYYSLSNDHMNNVMKTLTLVSMFFMPLTFIAGVYGMNFHFMPELSWRFGYLFVWLIMIGITIGMYVYFKKKGWFD